MPLRIFSTLLFAACLSAWSAAAIAQQSGSAFGGTNTSSGLFGSRSLGQGVGGGGGSAFGGAAAGGTPGNRLEQVQSGAGEVQGGERFTREGRQAGQFVGADSADSANFAGQAQGITANGLEQLLGQAAQRDFQNQGNAAGRSRTPLRPALRLGFESAGIDEALVSSRMSQRLTKLPNLAILDAVTIALADQTAILRGRVATEHDRRMIAQIARMEPGVSDVRNELLVGDMSQPNSVPPLVGADAAGDVAPPVEPPIPPSAPVFDAVDLELPPLAAPTAPSADE